MEPRTIPLADLPPQLAQIPRPPERLWVRGELPSPELRLLTVVGSRALSAYGRQACGALIGGLAGSPIAIVSGLALGTDGVAHEAALAAGLPTVAIPGSGLGDAVIGPRAHLPLARRILAAGGALLSEHPPDHQARPYDFPSRNRIMVGLAHAILMIEAAEDSGTLITAGLAGEYGRELLCVPHRIGDAHGYGASRFLRLGATLATEPAHILESLGIDGALKAPADPAEPEQRALLAHLRAQADGAAADALAAAAGLPIHALLAHLAELELSGAAYAYAGRWFAASAAPVPVPRLDHI